MTVRTRPPRQGTIVADIADYLDSKGRAWIGEIHANVNARRQGRGLPAISKESIRGTLNSNTDGGGHELFKRERRGLYSLAESKRASLGSSA
jgi:hypothetical protein